MPWLHGLFQGVHRQHSQCVQKSEWSDTNKPRYDEGRGWGGEGGGQWRECLHNDRGWGGRVGGGSRENASTMTTDAERHKNPPTSHRSFLSLQLPAAERMLLLLCVLRIRDLGQRPRGGGGGRGGFLAERMARSKIDNQVL